MTSVFSARRRAEEFAAVVDGAAAPHDAELTEFAGVVTALRVHEAPVARPEFAADLRARLLAEAETALAGSTASLVLPTRARGKRERRLAVAATVAVLVGGSASMAAAAQQALPGEALYPIKRGIEHAQTELSASPAGRGRDLLQQAGDRLTEAQGLLAGGASTGSPQLPQTIDDFTSQAREGSALLMSSFQQSQDPATIAEVRGFAAHSLSTLQDLARTAPPDSQDELAAAASTLGDIDAQARGLCASCAQDLPALDVPPMFLAAAEARSALRSLDPTTLNNSHPVVVDKRAVAAPKAPKVAVPSRPAAPQTSAAATAPETSAPAAPGLTLPGLPGLPGADEQAKKGTTDLGKTTDQLGKTVTNLTDGLGGVVATLLPDPTDSPNPLP